MIVCTLAQGYHILLKSRFLRGIKIQNYAIRMFNDIFSSYDLHNLLLSSLQSKKLKITV